MNKTLIFILLSLCCFIAVSVDQVPCVKWGNTFDVSLESKNVIRGCAFPDGRSICCAALLNSSSNVLSRGVGLSFTPASPSTMQKSGRTRESRTPCVLKKEYISSPLELRDLEKSKHIEASFKLEDVPGKLDALLTYVTSDETIQNSTIWLERVKMHMSSEHVPKLSVNDFEYLSRFQYTRTCSGGNGVEEEVESWNEWIEPVTITARHPFGFGRCRNTGQYFTQGKPKVGRSDVDYVLLQSGASLYNQTHTASGRRIMSTVNVGDNAVSGGVTVQNKGNKRGGMGAKHYMLDAGTSTFDSSLFWFTCGYSQVSVALIILLFAYLMIY
jgi:hypothetical protein